MVRQPQSLPQQFARGQDQILVASTGSFVEQAVADVAPRVSSVAAASAADPRSQGFKDRATRRRTLVVAKFPRTLSELALTQAFASLVGQDKVTHCRIIREATGRSKCYAFIEFADDSAARKAQAACDAGELVLVDAYGDQWCVTASRSKRAMAGPTKKTEKRRAAGTEDLFDDSAAPLRLIL